MIKLTDKYFITIDELNITLFEKAIAGEKAKNPGEIKYKKLGYYTDLKGLAKGIIRRKLAIDTGRILLFESYVTLKSNELEELIKGIKEEK